MRLSTSSSNNTVICCCDALLIFAERNSSCTPTFIPIPPKIADKQASKGAQQNRLGKDASASKSEDQEQAEEKEVVVGCCISICEQLLAAITSHKQLLVWRCAGPGVWQLSRSWQLLKRPVDLVFDLPGQHVLIADKTGDVLNFSLSDTDKDGAPPTDEPCDGVEERSPAPVLLGHLSMLLSITISRCGRYLASSDRDEKIRVSSYPRAHNIASFCLGHSEFVSQLRALPSSPALLLSASGDGTLRLWTMEDGQELSVLDTHQHSRPWAIDTPTTFQSTQDTVMSDNEQKDVHKTPGNEDGNPNNNNDSACNADESQSNGDDGQCNKSNSPGSSNASSGHTNGRDRVVPKQSAIVSVAVSTDSTREGADVVAAVFDKSGTVAVYGVTPDRRLQFRGQASLPRPASTVCWSSPDTLVTVSAAPTSEPLHESRLGAREDNSPVLVWRWDGTELTRLSQHPLSVFAAQHRHRFHGVYAMDPQVLYKQRYDNVADYQKKKQVRIQQQAEHQKQVQEQHMMRQSKRLRLADPAEQMS